MKKAKVSILAVLSTTAMSGAGLVVPSQAFAATSYYSTGIYVDGNSVSSPKHIDAYDGSNLTAFLPLFYVNQALGKYGFTGTWDGNNWNISVPQGTSTNLDNPQSGQQTNSKTLSMSINGEVVQYAPRQVAVDPASGQSTTYLPIWYIDQVIGRLGIQASWSGTVWGMQRITPATKLQAVNDFMRILGVSGDSNGINPFDDVSAGNWPTVHRAIENGYFSSDSSTHFGSSDAATVNDVDHAYQLFLGIPDSHMSWNAGGSLSAWSNIIGINEYLNTASVLSVSSEAQMMSNISHIQAGYYKDSSGAYHLAFHPYDAFVWSNPNYKVSQQIVSSTLATEIPLIDQVSFTVNGTNMEFKTKGLSDKANYSITIGSLFNHGGNFTEYSLNGGNTWHQTTGDFGYDSWDPANGGVSVPSPYVLVKTNNHVEIAPSVMDSSSIQGSVSLMSISITPSDTPTVKYGSTTMAQ